MILRHVYQSIISKPKGIINHQNPKTNLARCLEKKITLMITRLCESITFYKDDIPLHLRVYHLPTPLISFCQYEVKFLIAPIDTKGPHLTLSRGLATKTLTHQASFSTNNLHLY